MPGFALYALLAAVVGYLLGSVGFSVASRLIARTMYETTATAAQVLQI